MSTRRELEQAWAATPEQQARHFEEGAALTRYWCKAELDVVYLAAPMP